MIRAVVLGVAATLLCGCISVVGLGETGAMVEDAPPPVPNAWEAAQQTIGDVQPGWIDALNDPLLSAYVKEAQAKNRDLQIAAGAVAEARALARQAGAALYPAVNLTAAAGRSGVINLESADSYSVGFELGWEIDIWRRVRASKDAAALSAYSAEADYVFSQYSIAAAVAQSYFAAIEARRQLSVSKRSFDALEETDRIVAAQRTLGAVSGLDVALSKRDLANARDSELRAEGAVRIATRALSVLLGRYPSAIADMPPDFPTVPPPPAADVPSGLLNRRPDLIAAELAVGAAFNAESAAQAARLPTFSLTSTIGGSSTDLEDVLDPENVIWQAIANMAAPAFDAGLRKARADEARAKKEQALNAYAATVIDALREVETSLDQNALLRERVDVLSDAAIQANRAFEIAQTQYREGETNLIDVLTIQNTSFAAESALVSVQSALLTEWINLNLALGGDWRTDPPAQ